MNHTENNKQTQNSVQTNNRKKRTSKQIVALVGVVLLVLLYIVTLLAAVFDSSSSGRFFQACLFATVAVPLLIWVYTWMYGKLTGRKTIADLNIGGSDTSANDGDDTK